ncbi:glucuronidase 1 [Hibiscus trionum]|uniref:Glucuronidase 1 n=1 Tax=Hibiscus trionum TaxID=183268 RepID=A0A9W7IDQ9_HIBTR|nr:glucuronidase 1 [Hibiscus trionum]
MYFKFTFCPIILLLWASLSFAQNVNVVIHGAASIAKTDDNFVCVTLDWWPAEKCDYNQCPWGKAGILNLDLRYEALINAIKAFNPLRIKVGGSLQDNVVYKVGEVSSCPNFMKREDGLFGFSQGCLSMERWDQLNRVFNHTGVKLTFGLNALFGRNESQTEKGLWICDWQPQNTRDFMQYTISKGYKVDSYEFGNQLSGSGMGAKLDAKQYGKDVIVLKNLVKELYAHPETQPKVLGPGGFYEEKWFNTFLEVSGQGIVDGLTHHIYNLGPGDDPNMMNKILDPSYLNQVSQTYKGVSDVVNKFRPQLGAWVSESGGALNGGSKDVSRTFADGFWYLDQMGMASTYDQKVFCRQALIGGNYGLLNATTFVPNPDYYGALLWHRLMGSTVLAVTKESDPNLRVYAHCAKKKHGVSLIIINLSKDRSFNITLSNAKPGDAGKLNYEFVGKQNREEYHLRALTGDIKDDIVCLNDVPMVQTDSEDIPAMDPKLVDASTPISIVAQSIAYVTIRDFEAPACV